MKIALLFPGQGSNTIGLGKDFYNKYIECREVFDYASSLLGKNILEVLSDEVMMKDTKNSQLAISSLELAIFRTLQNIPYVACAGHSLGQFAAIYASGATDLSILDLIKERSDFMNNVTKHGKMIPIFGNDIDKNSELLEIINKLNSECGPLVLSNINSPTQVVASGTYDATFKLIKHFEGRSDIICSSQLPVSNAFHSPIMLESQESFKVALQKFNFNKIKVPYISNVTATFVENSEDIKKDLELHITSPVLWADTGRLFRDEKFDTFLEIGPGRVLSGFIRKICPDAKYYHVGMVEDLECLSSIKA